MYKPCQNADVVVGQRGQVVIPAAVRAAMGLCDGDKLFMTFDPETGWLSVRKVSHDSLLRLQQAAGDAFTGVDATEFVRELRREWEGREERLERIRRGEPEE